MVKELNIEKIIKRVQSDSDKRFEKIVKHFEQKVDVLSAEIKTVEKNAKNRGDGLLEEFQSRVSGIAEQYGDIQKTLKSHTEKLDILYVDMTAVKSTIGDMPSHIIFLRDTKLDKKHFAELDQRVRRLEKK